MKAFLLAAGLGTRLRPLTESIPKCLVPIGNKPLMAYWFKLFEKHGVSEVLVNLHYLPEKVREFVEHYRTQTPLKIHLVYEEQLLGSAGTLWYNRHWVEKESEFLIAYGDNLTNANLSRLVGYHKRHQPVLTMAVFQTSRPRECGIATIDHSNMIVQFEEKPENPQSNLANAGLFVASPKIYEYFPPVSENQSMDIGFDLLPRLVGKMKAYLLHEYLMDIGNLDRYQKAQIDVKKLIW